MSQLKLYIGCSSYATASWKSIFYPQDLHKRDWFKFYVSHFGTYEFNGSFYKFPTAEYLTKWHNRVDENFKFSIKAPRIITHVKKLDDCTEEIKNFYNACREGLKNKLACILWQLPPSFDFSTARLHSVLQNMNPAFKNVVEFRHVSWWQADVFRQFADQNITFCTVNYPGLPTSTPQTTPIGYIRMHGNPKLFYTEYTSKEIEALSRQINRMDFEELYVYFNNTASTAGIINALQLQKIQV
jgi:uncharacterized protein YecE (DUF72 family)